MRILVLVLVLANVIYFVWDHYLRVSVSPSQLRVEYVRSVPAQEQTSDRRNGAVVHAWSLRR